MIICICNNLNTQTIKDTLETGCKCKEVHEHCGCEVACGKCLEQIAQMKKELEV